MGDEISVDSELKIQKQYFVDSLEISANSETNMICVSNNFFTIDILEDKEIKLCTFCLYDVVEGFDINIHCKQVTLHATIPTINFAGQIFQCRTCSLPLFSYVLTKYCLLCNGK